MAKITDDELQRLSMLKQDALEVASILGELTYQKVSLELEIEKQRKIVARIKDTESQIFEELRSKYGNVSVNIETGELN